MKTTQHMNCRRPPSSRRLVAYADGALEPRDADDIRRHLAACPSCRARVALDLRIARAIGSLPAWEAPPSVTSAVMARVRATPLRAHRRLARWLPVLRIAVPLVFVVALFAAVREAGLFQLAFSFVSTVLVGTARAVTTISAAVGDAFEPVARALAGGHFGRLIPEMLRAVIEATPLSYGVAMFLVMVLVLLVGLRRHVARAPGGVRHAAII